MLCVFCMLLPCIESKLSLLSQAPSLLPARCKTCFIWWFWSRTPSARFSVSLRSDANKAFDVVSACFYEVFRRLIPYDTPQRQIHLLHLAVKICKVKHRQDIEKKQTAAALKGAPSKTGNIDVQTLLKSFFTHPFAILIIYTYIYIYVYMYVCIYIYIYIYMYNTDDIHLSKFLIFSIPLLEIPDEMNNQPVSSL